MGDTIHFTAAAGQDCHSSLSIPNLNQKEIIYPNAFTPNHDDINDEFLLPPINCEGSITIHIYDKWGSILQSHQQKCADSMIDRKSTRLNSSHVAMSCAVFCLKNKNLLF